jgi:hypothetical protein
MPLSKLPLLLLFSALPTFAGPIITNVSPSSGPVAGGTTVTINGSGFLPGARAFFGGIEVPAQVINSTTIEAVTPEHLPGLNNVGIVQSDGGTQLRAFTYTGDAEPTFKRILIPVLIPPVHGAFGSEFRMILIGSSFSGTRIYGLKYFCPVLCGYDPTVDAIVLNADGRLGNPEPNGAPGRFIFIPSSTDLQLNLRAYDVSRDTQNFGTEVPIAHGEDFKQRIRLHSIPIDTNFRNTLRIYSDWGTDLPVTIELQGQSRSVTVKAGRNLFEPGYAEFTDFPTAVPGNPPPPSIDVTISVPTPVVLPPTLPRGIWAFISVTNNTTQHITTISPN